MSKINELLKSKIVSHSAIYAFGNFSTAGIAFLLLPIITRYLSTSDYGLLAMFNIVGMICTTFIQVGTHGCVTTNFHRLETKEIQQYIGNLLWIIFSTTLLCLVSCYFSAPYLSSQIQMPIEYFQLAVIFGFSQALIQLVLSLLQISERPFNFLCLQLLRSIVNIGLSLYLVVSLNQGALGRITAIIISVVIVAISSIYFLHKERINLRVNYIYLKDAISFGIPLIPHALAGWLNSSVDRLFIGKMIGLSEVGLYTLGFQISSVLQLLIKSGLQAWYPWLFKKLSNPSSEDKIRIVKLSYTYWLTLILLALIFGLIFPIIFKGFVSEEFHSGFQFILWLSLSFAFTGMYSTVVTFIFYSKKTTLLFMATFGTSLINIPLNYVLIDIYGAIGAAKATLITHIITFLVVWTVSARCYPMPWLQVFKSVKN